MSNAESEWQYYNAENRNDLMQKTLEGYWDVKPVQSVSDKLNAQIAELKEKHRAELQNVKAQNRQALADEHARSKAAIQNYKAQRDAMDKAQKALYEAERKQVQEQYQKQIQELESAYSEDTATMQREFLRLLKAYGSNEAELRKQLAGETKRHDKESAVWEKEFNRLLKEYESSGRNVDRLEKKVQHQRDAARDKVEGRRKTEMRGKIERTVKELNRYLLHPTTTVHVPASLQSSVSLAMEAINSVMTGSKTAQNAQRIGVYARELEKLMQNPEDNAGKISDVQRKIQTMTGRDGRMKTAMGELMEQYRQLRESSDPFAAQTYDEVIDGLMEQCYEAVGETEYHNMSLDQLKMIQKTYRALLRRIQTANKAFLEGKQASISEKVDRFYREMSVRAKKNKMGSDTGNMADQFFWNNLKPQVH